MLDRLSTRTQKQNALAKAAILQHLVAARPKKARQNLIGLLNQFKAELPKNFDDAKKVVLCFHGHTNSAEHEKEWPLPFEKCGNEVSFVYLNGLLPYGSGYEWFSYKDDTPVDNVDPAKLTSIQNYMHYMNLEAEVKGFRTTIERIKALYNALSEVEKQVYFIGTSQGAATAFTAAISILHGSRPQFLRGVIAHRMAGLYPELMPFKMKLPVNVSVKVNVDNETSQNAVLRKTQPEDTHGYWMQKDAETLERMLCSHDDSDEVFILVLLNIYDQVVPHELSRFIKMKFKLS